MIGAKQSWLKEMCSLLPSMPRRFRRRSYTFYSTLLLICIFIVFLYSLFPDNQSVDYNDNGIPNRPHAARRKILPRPQRHRDFPQKSDSLESQIDDSDIELAAKPVPLPVYREDGKLGNFEPKPSPKRRKLRPGDNGKKFVWKGPDELDQNEIRSKKNEYGMNMVASDHIPMDRIVPDIRSSECKYWDYPEKLPSASVVIVFHNEGFTTLLRTVHSVLIRSPKRFLREVLLVDDFSDKENLKAQLEDYIIEHFGTFKSEWKPSTGPESMSGETLEDRSGKVRVIRNKERSGLIRSRAHGAHEALGEVVVFLDAHCEVNINWLVPLLAPIAANNRTMTVPVIDGIDSDTFEYRPVYQKDQHFIGIWEWGMLYKEQRLNLNKHLKNHRFSEPYESPTHAGGLLAINRKYFFELGGYDEGLLVWGGENFELSFKVWQCGGRILWVPCSRVGHIYRPFMPYGFGKLAQKRKGPLVLINYKRVVEVWFDEEYKRYFYTREPMAQFYDAGDISKQLEMKERLQCKSFDWFVQNHAKSIFEDFPPLPPNVGWGELRSVPTPHMCLDSTSAHPPSVVMVNACHGTGGNQLFRLNAKGQLGLGERCVDANEQNVFLIYCKMGTVDGPWKYDKDTQQMTNKGQCLSYHDGQLLLDTCASDDENQKWYWHPIKPRSH